MAGNLKGTIKDITTINASKETEKVYRRPETVSKKATIGPKKVLLQPPLPSLWKWGIAPLTPDKCWLLHFACLPREDSSRKWVRPMVLVVDMMMMVEMMESSSSSSVSARS